MGGELKRRGAFCTSAHKKVIVSQINLPLSIIQPLVTSDPSISKSALRRREERGQEQAAGGATHPPRVSGDKRVPQLQLAESVKTTNVGATKQKHHRLNTQPLPVPSHFTTPRFTIGAALRREVPQNTQTHMQSYCLPITEEPLSCLFCFIGRKVS